MSISDDNENVIPCAAVDGEIHVYLPWVKVTACDDKLEVTSKDVTKNDSQ
jgi:hypothetical protein